MSITLYNVPAAWAELRAEIDASDGELTPDLEARLAELELHTAEGIDGAAVLIREADAEADAYTVELERLQHRRAVARNRADRLRRLVMEALQAVGITSVKTDRFRVRVQRNGTPAIRWEGREDELPDGYRRVTVEPDLNRVREDYRSGRALPVGFVVTVGSHLRIQ